MRDSYESQFCGDEWSEFRNLLDECNFHNWSFQVTVDNVENWMKAIKSLKAGKAEGACGWGYQEFHQFPVLAVRHLALIFERIWDFGLTPKLMLARVCLLEKRAAPKSMADARPVTILPCLYRLAAKMVFQQVIAHWADRMPIQVSGGIAGRGVRDLSIVQTIHVEKALCDQEFPCSSTMDLAKAFNLVPRYPAAILMNRLGVPWSCLNFWLQSLSNMSRSPLIAGSMGTCIGSTTGVPEGDVLSILAMLAISALFYYRNLSPRVSPFAYADNWAWQATTLRDNFLSWIKTLNSVAVLIVSIPKCWMWVTSPKFVSQLQDVNLLFPSGGDKIPV
jgi:hypothetical protein